MRPWIWIFRTNLWQVTVMGSVIAKLQWKDTSTGQEKPWKLQVNWSGIHFCKEEILSRTSWKERNVLSYTYLKSHMSILTELSFIVCMIKESWCEFNRYEYVTKTKQVCMYIWNKLHMLYRCLYVYHKYLTYVRFFNYNSTQWVTLMSSLNWKKNCNKNKKKIQSQNEYFT